MHLARIHDPVLPLRRGQIFVCPYCHTKWQWFRRCSNSDFSLFIPTSITYEAHLKQYAHTMAEAIALMHWIGSVDGRGIEFILAPPWGGIIKADTVSNVLGDHCMWVCDFDLCRDMSMDEAGVEQAVKAFWHAEPFYPRPATGDSLWFDFREQYLRTSEERLECGLLDESICNHRKTLSQLFIQIVEKRESD